MRSSYRQAQQLLMEAVSLKRLPCEVVDDDPYGTEPVAWVGTEGKGVHRFTRRKRTNTPARAEAVIGKIIDLYQFVGLRLRCDAAPEGKESGEHLNPHRKALPRHVHAARHRRNEFGATVDTLDIDGIEVAVPRVPAVHPDLLGQSLGLRGETIAILRTSKPPGEFSRCKQVLVEETVEQKIGGREGRPAKCGRVVVVANRNIVAPYQQTNGGRVVSGPRVIKTQNRVEVRRQPAYFSALICGEQAELAEHGLGLIFRRSIGTQNPKWVWIGRGHQDRDPSFSRGMIEKVQQAAGDVLAELLLERLIMLQLGKSKESLAGPKRVPIPELS